MRNEKNTNEKAEVRGRAFAVTLSLVLPRFSLLFSLLTPHFSLLPLCRFKTSR